MSLAELAERVGASVAGDGSVRIARVATLASAGPDAIAFLSNPRYRRELASTRAGALILAAQFVEEGARPALVSANPYATYARVAALLHPPPMAAPGIHPTAVVAADAVVAASASIGPHVVIGRGARIGERTVVHAGCSLGDEVEIGDDGLLHPRVVIYARCVLGPRAIVHSGAVIGADGFGMAEDGGCWLKIPQIGRVVVGADVEIGANTTIDRGALDDTVIEDDVKLDNQIQIGHNCRIGAHTAIAGCAGIAGSTRIGKNCRIGGAAMISGHLEIADGTTVSGGTSVVEPITEAGIYTSIVPVLPHKEWRRVAATYKRLRQLADRVRVLERSRGGDTPEENHSEGEPHGNR